MAQTVKNLPAMQETWVWSLGWEDPLEESMVTHPSILPWRIPMDRGAWQGTVYRVAKSQTWLSNLAESRGGVDTQIPILVISQGRDVSVLLVFDIKKIRSPLLWNTTLYMGDSKSGRGSRDGWQQSGHWARSLLHLFSCYQCKDF